jgi:hypothetical protein
LVELLARKSSPLGTYVADKLFELTGRLATDVVATPPLNVPVPMIVLPSRNVTVPAGVPAPGLVTVTVADKVTLAPY